MCVCGLGSHLFHDVVLEGLMRAVVFQSWPPIFLYEWLRNESRDFISSCALGSPSNIVTIYNALSYVLSRPIHTTLCEATEPPFPHLTRRENGLTS